MKTSEINIREINEIKILAKKLNMVLLDFRNLSGNPQDAHLKIVRVFDHTKKEYIVYLYNAEKGAFLEGTYFPENREHSEGGSFYRFCTKR